MRVVKAILRPSPLVSMLVSMRITSSGICETRGLVSHLICFSSSITSRHLWNTNPLTYAFWMDHVKYFTQNKNARNTRTHRQTGRTDRRTDGQTDRQTDRHSLRGIRVHGIEGAARPRLDFLRKRTSYLVSEALMLSVCVCSLISNCMTLVCALSPRYVQVNSSLI